MQTKAAHSNEYALLARDENSELIKTFHAYKVKDNALKTIFIPFMGPYKPIIGVLDPFVKPLRPDGEADQLGLVQMDEPSLI